MLWGNILHFGVIRQFIKNFTNWLLSLCGNSSDICTYAITTYLNLSALLCVQHVGCVVLLCVLEVTKKNLFYFVFSHRLLHAGCCYKQLVLDFKHRPFMMSFFYLFKNWTVCKTEIDISQMFTFDCNKCLNSCCFLNHFHNSQVTLLNNPYSMKLLILFAIKIE